MMGNRNRNGNRGRGCTPRLFPGVSTGTVSGATSPAAVPPSLASVSESVMQAEGLLGFEAYDTRTEELILRSEGLDTEKQQRELQNISTRASELKIVSRQLASMREIGGLTNISARAELDLYQAPSLSRRDTFFLVGCQCLAEEVPSLSMRQPSFRAEEGSLEPQEPSRNNNPYRLHR